jgi:hypothetical protein
MTYRKVGHLLAHSDIDSLEPNQVFCADVEEVWVEETGVGMRVWGRCGCYRKGSSYAGETATH